MFYDDLKVPIPQKKRIRKGSNYVYEILRRKGKEYPKDVVACVGKAIDQIYMIPNEIYFEIHKETEIPEPKQKSLLLDTSLNIGTYLIVKNLAKKEGLHKALLNTYGEAADIILSYISYVLVYQCTDPKLHKYFGYNHYHGLSYVPNDIKLMQYFNKIFDGAHTNRFKKLWLIERLDREKDNPNFQVDFSSFTIDDVPTIFNVEKRDCLGDETLFKYSVNYLLEKKSGIPLYYDIYCGSSLSLSHGFDIIKNTLKFKPDLKGDMVLDSNYFSKSNLENISGKNITYFALSDKNKLYKALIKKYPQSTLWNSDNKLFSLIYGIKIAHDDEILKEFNLNDNVNFYLINNETYVRQRSERELETLKVLCKYLTGKNDSDKKIKSAYGKFIKFVYDEDKNIIEASPNMHAFHKFVAQLGYSLIVSNTNETPLGVYASFKQKETFEKTFKLGLVPGKPLSRVPRLNFTYNALGTIGFLTGILKNMIINAAKQFIYQFPNETSLTILLEVDKICANKQNNKYVLQYALSKKQKEILKIFGLEFKDVMDVIDEMNAKLVRKEELLKD